MGLPDVHSGYGFAIGNMAAFDTSDPQSVVSPGKLFNEWGQVGHPLEVGRVVKSCAYWNVNYFGILHAIAVALAVVVQREHAVLVACCPLTIDGCSHELSMNLTTNLKTIDSDNW